MCDMAQQSSLTFFENANSQPDFTVVLRGYDRPQVDDFVQRLNAALVQSEAARAEAEQRLNEAQRRGRQAEQALTSAQQKLTDQNKQIEESSRPTLSGLGTRVEQILRLAEEQNVRPKGRLALFRLSYARAQQVAPLLERMLRPAGRVSYDSRSNTLIVSY